MKHLTARLVILLMLALMTITAIYDYFRLVREREQLVEQTREDARVFAETLALAVRWNVRRGRTTEELQELLTEILARPGLIGVGIYDPDGRVVATSVAEGKPASTRDDAIQEALKRKEAASLMLEAGGAQILSHIQPFRWPGGRTAAVEVRQTLEGVERQFGRAIRERLLSRLVVLTFFVLSIAAVTRWSIARPIRALIEGARAVGQGDLAQRIHLARADEIGQLAEEFNRMAANLEAAHQEIVQQGDERLRLEQELQRAQKLAAVGMLAAEVAHEVGTPLNVISGRAEALERTIPLDHPAHRHLDVILKQTERITGIIRALLDYTRPRRPVLRQEAVLPLLGRVADVLLGRTRAKGVRIQLDLPVALPAIQGDADQLQQAFLNLLLNALDASPPGGIVRVSAGDEPVLPAEGRVGIMRGKAETPCLAIHIVDSGNGMTAEQLAHVFEPFFSTKGRGQGTGLGLPIVEEIVRAHRGEVEMLSVPGNGTEVIVRLPLAPDRAGDPSGAVPEHAPESRNEGR